MKAYDWIDRNISSLKGKTVIVTGGNSGLGFEVCKLLVYKEADVILTARNIEKGERAIQSLKNIIPNSSLSLFHLDLSDLNSIYSFSQEIKSIHSSIDGLICNAGVMFPPYTQTKDGFELQFGTNHLGHFALTGWLLPLLEQAKGSRVVTVTSVAARRGHIDFENLDGRNGYDTFQFYAQSKLANLLFAKEFQNRLSQSNSSIKSIACHPGVSKTNLFAQSSFGWKLIESLIGQSAEMGSLPLLHSLTDPTLKGGELVGPNKLFGLRGYPKIEESSEKSYEQEIANQLWNISEELTKVTYMFEKGN